MPVVIRSTNIGKFRGDFAEHVAANPGVGIWKIQEALAKPGRREELESVPAHTLYMAQVAGRPKAGDSPLLIHDSIPQRTLPPIHLRRTWKRPRGPGRHPARTINRAEVQIDGQWVEVQSNHNPERRGFIRLARREYIGMLLQTVQVAARIVLGGDFNGKASETGPGFPGQLRTKAGMVVAGTRKIDEFYGKGVIFRDTEVLDRLGDHFQVQTVVSVLPVTPPPDAHGLLLSSVGRLEAAVGRIETAVADLRAAHAEEPPA